MNVILKSDIEYKQWLTDLKFRIRNSQIKAALKVNAELINLYWELGKEIVSKQEQSQWGDGLIKQLSSDLQQEFPEMKGFSTTNIKYIKRWYSFYNQDITIVNKLLTNYGKQFHKFPGDIIYVLSFNANPLKKHFFIYTKQLKTVGAAVF